MFDINIIIPKNDEALGIVQELFDKSLINETPINADNHNNRKCKIYEFELNLNKNRSSLVRVAITVMNSQNNTNSSLDTAYSLEYTKPKLAILAGTALGKESSITLESIVLSGRVFDVCEKRNEGNKESPQIYEYSSLEDTEIDLYVKTNSSRKIIKSPILSGNDYIGQNSERIWEYQSKSKAYDMESAGFCKACDSYSIPWIVMRVISDYGTTDSIADSKGSTGSGEKRSSMSEKLGEEIRLYIKQWTERNTLRQSKISDTWVGAMGYVNDGKIVIYTETVELREWNQGCYGKVIGILHKEYSNAKTAKMEYMLNIRNARDATVSGDWESCSNSSKRHVGALVGKFSHTDGLSESYNQIKGGWLGFDSKENENKGYFLWYRKKDGKTKKAQLEKAIEYIIYKLNKDTK